MLKSAAAKSRPPYSACTGSNTEMVTKGGELGFVTRLLDESINLGSRIQWYTAMLGFLSSVITMAERLRERGIDNYAVTELVQGGKTRRWVVGWSFGSMRPSMDAARGTGALPKHLLPAITEVDVFRTSLTTSVGGFADHVRTAVASLELMSWTWDGERLEGVGRAVDKVWGRAWRRQRKREDKMNEEGSAEAAGTRRGEAGAVAKDISVFGFGVLVRVTREEVVLRYRWIEGYDATASESFQGFLKATAQSHK